MKTRTMSAMLVASAALLGACGGSAEDEREAAAPEIGTASGTLTLETDTKARVSGTFRKDGVSIAFELRKDGTARRAIIRTAADTPLFESTTEENGAYTTRLLGGRLVIEGSAEGAPSYSGDRSAEDELGAIPEAKCLSALEAALTAANVEPSLLPPTNADRSGAGLHPTWASTPYVVADPCGTNISPDTQSFCGSKLFGSTEIWVKNCSSQYRTVIFDGVVEAIPPKFLLFGYVPICGSKNHSGWYAGRAVKFFNSSAVPIYFGH